MFIKILIYKIYGEDILKFYRISIIFLVLLIFSVGFVSAEDVNSTNLEVADTNVVQAPSTYSYMDLKDLIFNGPDDTNMTADYKYNPEKDGDLKDIKLNFHGETYLIEGNNHVIDANNQVGAFSFLNGTIVINNLVIKNCNGSAIVLDGCSLTTNNVTFENNWDNSKGSSVVVRNSVYYSYGDKFIDNYAKYGTDVFISNSTAVFDRSVFINTNPVYWSLIYSTESNVTVLNTVFENISSRYATAIYSEKGGLSIINSKFKNLYANATSGAVAVKGKTSVLIQNCEFENVSSAKNGGAVFIDMNGDSDEYLRGTSIINATIFTDCSSEFGGALMQLGGCLNIIHSDFIANHATFAGGAIYTSNATLYAVDTMFDRNIIELEVKGITRGGALYLDYSDDIEIEQCTFKNNTALEGGAILSFDTFFKITYCEFIENGEAIHAYFPREGSLFDNCKVHEDEVVLNDTYYPSVVGVKGKEIVLNPINLPGSVGDAYFNLADYNAITPVKNQGMNGACWAFGTNGALESAFLIATNITLDLSENNLQNSAIRYSYYGRLSLTESGYLYSGLSYYVAWLGAVNTEYDSYDEMGKISTLMFTPESFHVLDVVYINTSNIEEVKQALLDYGALTIFVTGAAQDSPYFNPKTNSIYCDDAKELNHFVTLVGWNDTFSKDDFNIKPAGDGAWICKNSWGTDWGDKGFYYLSYYDAPVTSRDAIAYKIENTVNYNKMYQYDIAGQSAWLPTGISWIKYVNNYEAMGDDLIAAVGLYFDKVNVGYNINVYVNGTEMYSQSGKSIYRGYQTVKLDKYVCVNEGDIFSIEVEVENGKVPISDDSRLFYEKGCSLLKNDKGQADDLTDAHYVACVKAYTIENINMTSDVIQYYDSDKVVIPSDLEGALMTISQNSKEIAHAIVSGGKATFKMNILPGKYSITTLYNSTEIVNYLELIGTVRFLSNASITMDYNGGATCQVEVLDTLGDSAVFKTVFFTINGKTYYVQANKNGVATFKIPNSVTPGTYNLTVFCNYQTLTKTVKVKQVLKSSSTVTVKKSAKKVTLKATLKTSAGKAIKNKSIIFKVNGKTYFAKTNSKGIAQVVIKGGNFNKFKAGKNYKVQITYLRDTIKTTLKVKR